MKNLGSIFEYEQERNEDLMRAFREVYAAGGSTNIPDIFKRVVKMPSQRFWVSEERAAIVITKMMKGQDVSDELRFKTKQRMFSEIFRRVRALQAQRPDASIYELTFEVVSGPAPEFYMTPGTAKATYYKIKNEWYEERKRKYRHLFM